MLTFRKKKTDTKADFCYPSPNRKFSPPCNLSEVKLYKFSYDVKVVMDNNYSHVVRQGHMRLGNARSIIRNFLSSENIAILSYNVMKYSL